MVTPNDARMVFTALFLYSVAYYYRGYAYYDRNQPPRLIGPEALESFPWLIKSDEKRIDGKEVKISKE